MRALSIAVVAAAALAGCFSAIGDGQVRCGLNGECPPSLSCNVADGKCYRSPPNCVSLHCLIGWCGPISDGCGHMINCGSCFPTDGSATAIVDMRGDARPDLAPCLAASPCTAGVCGAVSDRCGKPQVCGDCMPPGRCSADTANSCACTPKTPLQCSALGIHCGKYPDGCGGMIDCGACDHGQQCGAGGPYTCGTGGKCTPIKSCPIGVCGMTPDGCADVFTCPGMCGPGQICGGGGTPNRCG